MRVSLKIAGAFFGVFALLYIAGAIILDRAVVADFERLEMRQHSEDLRRVHASLTGIARDMRARVNDYAGWDETYAYVQGRAPTYIEDNFDDQWFARYDVDLLLFADDDRRILWARNRVPGAGALEENPAAFQGVLADARRVAPTAEIAAAGTVWTQHGPLLYAARPATRNNGGGAPHGLVVIGRFLDKGLLRNATQLDLAFVGMNGAGRNEAMQRALADIALTATMDSSWTEEGAVHALIALRAADLHSVGAIHAQRPRDVSALGARSVAIAAWMIAAVSALALTALFALLHVLVTGRILRLERHIRDQSGEPRPFTGDRGKDEIGALVAAYNALGARVRVAVTRAEDVALAGLPEAPPAQPRGKARVG